MWPFKPRDARKDNGRTFTEIERDKSHISRLENEIRKQRVKFLKEKLERLKASQEEEMLEEQIADLEADMDRGDDDETPDVKGTIDTMNNPDAMMLNLLTMVLQNKKPQTQQILTTPQPPQKVKLSDDKLEELKTKIPSPVLKRLKKMSDAEILEFGRQYVPDYFEQLDDDTIARAMVILRT